MVEQVAGSLGPGHCQKTLPSRIVWAEEQSTISIRVNLSSSRSVTGEQLNRRFATAYV